MIKHAILLATREWCEAASLGKIKVYDFIKPRKRSIHALGPGSVCVVITKARANEPSMVYGEFTVIEVKEVDAKEYNRLARKGLIYNPQELGPKERRWVILFDEFREYRRKIPRKELTDVRTSPGKKPIYEWAIYGLTYVNEQVIESIRRKAGGFTKEKKTTDLTSSLNERIGRIEEKIAFIEELLGITDLPFPITHECAELMLLYMGRQLGFRVYTADPAKSCTGIKLKNLANMSKSDLSKYVGPEILDPLSKIDVVWYKRGSCFYTFEVVISGNMHDALLRLSRIGEVNVRLFIVAEKDRRKEYENSIRNPAFSSIRRKCKFLPLSSLVRMYFLTNLWVRSVKDLQLPFISS